MSQGLYPLLTFLKFVLIKVIKHYIMKKSLLDSSVPFLRSMILFIIFLYFNNTQAFAQTNFEKDIIKTSAGDLGITFIGHGSLMLTFQDKVIHIDPFSSIGEYTSLPKADLILVTHEHGDHLDLNALVILKKPSTEIVISEKCLPSVSGGIVMHNGDTRLFGSIKIEAVPAYNLVNGPAEGKVFHPKGQGNGYVLTVGDKRIYIAGDTENTPEMKALQNIDIAFLPMNLPYTMTPEMVADAAKAFKPKILYPYHFGDTDTKKIQELLKENKEIEIRIRKMN